jgi:lipopolysaccharide/colanic/teichoic acid biosynthesis glycosyltransferase
MRLEQVMAMAYLRCDLTEAPLIDDSNLRNAVLESEPSTDPSVGSSDSDCLSAWVQSPAKRAFDLALVFAMLPLLLPLFLIVACIVRLTSRGPVFFLQKRVGRNGIPFIIYKFRTMKLSSERRGTITTIDDPAITPIGRILRWWKLDEVPQFLNVLRGEMSLVGPRPKVPEQQTTLLRCRPGITGAATIAFAQEEAFLVGIPEDRLEDYFRTVLLPLKESLDARYMARATPYSDLRLLQNTAMRRWDRTNISHLLAPAKCIPAQDTSPLETRLGLGD